MNRPALLIRTDAAQAVVDRFDGKPFQFGERDCIQMGALNMRRMGYPNPLKGARPYRGEVGALRAFREAGKRVGLPAGAGLDAFLDALKLDRIEVAEALPGDLLGFPVDEGSPWGVALGVFVGNARAIAFTPQGIGAIGESRAAITAWRVEPCR